MKTIAGTISVAAGTHAGKANTFGRVVALVKSLGWRLERQRSRMQLAELTDDELRDIGLTRDQALSSANKHLFED